MSQVPNLGVNIDHIATLRNTRGTSYPDPIKGAQCVLKAGAYGITIHLREDRRHIQDEDVFGLRKLDIPKLNLEMALTEELVTFAEEVKPNFVCLVPENRKELTTEGGISIERLSANKELYERLKASGVQISLFLDPDPILIPHFIESFKPDAVELHTGTYAQNWSDPKKLAKSIDALSMSAHLIKTARVMCHAGHGLHLKNITPLLELKVFSEYNIGHAIIAKSVFDGLYQTVNQYLRLFELYPLDS